MFISLSSWFIYLRIIFLFAWVHVVLPDRKKQLGFRIRGGAEFNIGIFVSFVEPNSVAHACGLQFGDQVLAVNNEDLTDATHKRAIEVISVDRVLVMSLKRTGIVPEVSPSSRTLLPPPAVQLYKKDNNNHNTNNRRSSNSIASIPTPSNVMDSDPSSSEIKSVPSIMSSEAEHGGGKYNRGVKSDTDYHLHDEHEKRGDRYYRNTKSAASQSHTRFKSNESSSRENIRNEEQDEYERRARSVVRDKGRNSDVPGGLYKYPLSFSTPYLNKTDEQLVQDRTRSRYDVRENSSQYYPPTVERQSTLRAQSTLTPKRDRRSMSPITPAEVSPPRHQSSSHLMVPPNSNGNRVPPHHNLTNMRAPSMSRRVPVPPMSDEDFIKDKLPNRQSRTIRVKKVVRILGIAIEGGADTSLQLPRITKIKPDSCAMYNGELAVGMKLLEVNSKPLMGLTHAECGKQIAKSFQANFRDYIDFTVVEEP